MGRSGEEVVRFAIGGPDEPRSCVWRIWTGKGTSDVYISARVLGGVVKVSLHESGDWRFALTREYAEAQGRDNRLIAQWDRPPPLHQGVTSAFDIIVPSAELALPRQPLPEERTKHTKNVTWIRPAPEGFAKHFIVMYTEPGEPVPETEAEILASFVLPDGRTVIVAVFDRAVSMEEQQQLDAIRSAMAEGMHHASAEVQAAYENAIEPRGYLYGHNANGTRFFIDISGSLPSE